MMIHPQAAGAPDCRVATVPACELDVDASQTASIAALACFQMKIRDDIDFTVDFSTWLAANGSPVMTGATFAISSDSPSQPTIVGQAFSPGGKSVAVLKAGTTQTAAKAGDAYYLDVTAVFAATAPVSPADVAIPSRTLVRRIHVVVANG